MLLDPRTPLIVGSIAVLVMAAYLTSSRPMPGRLSGPHSQLARFDGLEGCAHCHTANGLTEGCLSCHSEIASQLDEDTGYHHFLSQSGEIDCAGCHQEHFGEQFELVNQISWKGLDPKRFPHSHVDYSLVGEHETLDCDRCHVEKRAQPFVLSGFESFPRRSCFLGLRQDCATCHENVHGEAKFDSCESCHDQDAFNPASLFDHDEVFTLEGAHVDASCQGCHVPPGGPSTHLPGAENDQLVFAPVRGVTCAECHDTPHRANFDESCDACHPKAATEWVAATAHMTASRHERTGFRLVRPHAELECVGCHKADLPFEERFADPASPGYRRREDTCSGCHVDTHAGQFGERYPRCLDCHTKHSFLPSNFDHSRHERVYPLTGAHLAVPCITCHEKASEEQPRRFTGTPSACKDCHEDVHAGQFRRELETGDCTACHDDAHTFAIRPFDHLRRTGYALLGAHAGAVCSDCHLDRLDDLRAASDTTPAALAREYRGTPTDCASCHRDVHAGQFRVEGKTACDRCHGSLDDWKIPAFDHAAQSRFTLDESHAKVPCSGCHLEVRVSPKQRVVQYKPLGTECEDCHAIIPR